MGTEWQIKNLTLQPDGKTTVADIAVLEDGVVVAGFAVTYTSAKMLQDEVLRKTGKYQSQIAAQQKKRTEAEAILKTLTEQAK